MQIACAYERASDAVGTHRRREAIAMDLFRTMLIFTRVVEACSFSTAAKALVLSPSSVTTAIQNLEETPASRTRSDRRTLDAHVG